MTRKGVIFSEFRRRLPSYRVFVRWFVGDLWRNFGGRLIAIAVAAVIGNAGQVSAFGVGFLYLRHLETGQPIQVLGREVAVAGSVLWLIVATGLAIAILLVAAAIEFWARRNCNRLAWRYGDHCARRLFQLGSVSRDWPVEDENCPRDASQLAKLSFKEARMLGIAARLVSFGTLHLAGLPLSFAALAWLDPTLTLLVVGSAVVGVIPYYLLSMRGAMYRNRLERFGRPAMQERRGLAQRVLTASGRIGADDADLIGAFDTGASYRHGEAFAEQRNVMEASTFASQIVIALALGLVITVGGVQVLAGAGTWSGLLAFLVVLRFAGMKLIGTARVLVSINRFYPSVRRYSDLMRGFDGSADGPTEKEAGAHPPVLQCRDAAGNAVALDRTAPLGLLLPDAPIRPHLAVLYRSLRLAVPAPAGGLAAASERPLERFWLATEFKGESAASLRTVIGLDARMSTDALHRLLVAYGCQSVTAKRIANRLDCPVDGRTRRQLGANGTFLLSLIAGELAHPDVLVVDAAVLKELPEAASALRQRQPSGTALILAANEIPVLEQSGVSQTIVSNGSEVLDVRTLDEIAQDADLARLMEDARKASRSRQDGIMDDTDELMM